MKYTIEKCLKNVYLKYSLIYILQTPRLLFVDVILIFNNGYFSTFKIYTFLLEEIDLFLVKISITSS